jgi:hypothetical protein
MQEFDNREFDEREIAAEAYGLWQADGSPLWGHPVDHWLRAVDNLRARAAAGAPVSPSDAAPATGEPPPLP